MSILNKLKWKNSKKLADVKKVELTDKGIEITAWKIDYTDDKDEWIKANPNAFKTKKWEEYKEEVMGKKEIRNVGFEKDVMVPVDTKTNLASIDVDMLSDLYKERDLEKGNHIYYRNLSCKLKENAELKEENERLTNKMKLMFNSVYGAHKGCDCHICCVRHSGLTAFAKAAESLAKHLEAGKPTYDQLLEENEKLKREIHSFRRGQESLEAEIDEIDKECDALVEEKEKLQAEINRLHSSLARFEKNNDELKNLQYITRDENTTLKMEVVKLRELCDEKDKKLEKVIKAHDNTINACDNYENTLKEELNKVTKELESYKKQCARLENEKINAWACAYETIETKDKLIKSLETRLDNVIKSRKEINDEYTEYVKNTEDQSYYSMWHNLADEYCKLEDKYNKVYIQYEKYKKYCEDIVDKIVATKRDDITDDMLSEPTGTGCCLKEEY